MGAILDAIHLTIARCELHDWFLRQRDACATLAAHYLSLGTDSGLRLARPLADEFALWEWRARAVMVSTAAVEIAERSHQWRTGSLDPSCSDGPGYCQVCEVSGNEPGADEPCPGDIQWNAPDVTYDDLAREQRRSGAVDLIWAAADERQERLSALDASAPLAAGKGG